MQQLQKTFLIIIFSPILLIFGFVWLIIFLRKKHCTKCIFKNIDINLIDSLNGYDFEELVAVMFKAKGFKVSTTPKSKDYGADIIAQKRNLKIVIQTKLYYNHTVGNRAIQEIHTAKHYYNAHIASVVTNWSFSKPAKDMADKLNVKLIDRQEIINIINNLNKKTKHDPLKEWINSVTI